MFINTSTLEYPISELQIRQAFANTSFPKPFLAPEPYAPVYGTAEPQYNSDTQRIEQIAPVQKDGRWEQAWAVIDLSDSEKQEIQQRKYTSASQSIRSERDALLKECDWTQLADAPVDQAAWATYRQALRDIPAQAGFPWDITWPAQP